MKVCKKCWVEKPDEAYSANIRMPDGKGSWCKPCINDYGRGWAKRNKCKLTWRNMRSRCNNPADISYANYGGRGIKVCDEWADFPTFQAWFDETYVPDLVLDRINNDGGYSPHNCRWTTLSEQNKNKRVTEKQLTHILAAQAISVRNRRLKREATGLS